MSNISFPPLTARKRHISHLLCNMQYSYGIKHIAIAQQLYKMCFHRTKKKRSGTSIILQKTFHSHSHTKCNIRSAFINHLNISLCGQRPLGNRKCFTTFCCCHMYLSLSLKLPLSAAPSSSSTVRLQKIKQRCYGYSLLFVEFIYSDCIVARRFCLQLVFCNFLTFTIVSANDKQQDEAVETAGFSFFYGRTGDNEFYTARPTG